jgi:hypothetical protein
MAKRTCYLSRATCEYGLACSAVLPLDSYPVSPEQAAESFYRRFCHFSDGLPQNRLQCGANRTGAKSIDSNSEEARRREHRRHDSHPVVERGDRCLSAGPFRAWRPNPELRNVAANYLFERSHKFPGIQPNSGRRDYSRLSCGVAETQLRPGASLSAAEQPLKRRLPNHPPLSAACRSPARLQTPPRTAKFPASSLPRPAGATGHPSRTSARRRSWRAR